MTTRRVNLPLAFGLLLTGGLLILLSRETADLVTVPALLIAALASPRVRMDALAQLALALILPTAALVLILVVPDTLPDPPPDRIGPVSRAACLGFLSVAALRLRMIRAPWAGDAVTAGIGFLALVSLGSPSRGLLFPLLSIPGLLLLIAGAGFRDPARRTGVKRVNSRYILAVALLTTTAAAVTALLIFSLPRLYARAMNLIEADWNAPETGFDFDLALDDLDGLAQSDTMVMRLHGTRTDYLRGAVYTRYRFGRWLEDVREERARLTVSAETSVSTSGETELRFLEAPDRFFLPQNAEVLALAPVEAELSTSGIVKPLNEAPAKRARIRILPHNPNTTETSPTDPSLTEVPKSLASNLSRIAASWTEDASDKLAVLKALERRLKRNFAYSLHVSIPRGKDPVLWFLTDGRAGWCETFASAMVLLARTQGISARVVGGYRVHEYNPVGGYYVVREKNAHAWVEAFIPGAGWTRFDPTPAAGEFDDSRTGWVFAAIDAAFDTLDRTEWRAVHFVGFTLMLLLIWIVIRLVRRLRARRTAHTTKGSGYTPPPADIAQLLKELSAAGFPRDRHEPLERYIPRLSAELPKTAPFAEAPAMLAAHVERRYGRYGPN